MKTDEIEPGVTIELILHRIETGMTTEGDALWLKHYLRVIEQQNKVLQDRVDLLEGVLQI